MSSAVISTSLRADDTSLSPTVTEEFLDVSIRLLNIFDNNLTRRI